MPQSRALQKREQKTALMDHCLRERRVLMRWKSFCRWPKLQNNEVTTKPSFLTLFLAWFALFASDIEELCFEREGETLKRGTSYLNVSAAVAVALLLVSVFLVSISVFCSHSMRLSFPAALRRVSLVSSNIRTLRATTPLRLRSSMASNEKSDPVWSPQQGESYRGRANEPLHAIGTNMKRPEQ